MTCEGVSERYVLSDDGFVVDMGYTTEGEGEEVMADEIVERLNALEAKLEAMVRAGENLLRVLPDATFYAKIDQEDSWGWCWNELSGDAQDHVKAAREVWVAAQQEANNEG